MMSLKRSASVGVLPATLLCSFTCSSALSQAVPTSIPLVVLWEVNVGSNGSVDYMTTGNSSERSKYPLLGQIAYARSGGDLAALYRLVSPTDHMDSLTQSVSGYTSSGVIASIWRAANALPGLAAISRNYNANTGDHSIVTSTVSAMYSGTPFANYSTEGVLGYGYPRYGSSTNILLSMSGGGITEGSDYVAGGAVASWVWNGFQFIDTHDYGRYMQSDIFYTASNGVKYNPIEAGDGQTGPNGTQPGISHGSPVLQNSISGYTHSTRSIPLEFGLGSSNNGVTITPDTPQIYPGMQIGKDLTLNFMNLGSVAQYNTVIVSPISLPNANIEIPAAYLNASLGKFFTYNASSSVLRSVAPSSCYNPATFQPSSGGGGMIVSDPTLSTAIGIYRRDSSTVFNIYDLRSCANTIKINADITSNLTSGTNTFTTYVVNGSLGQVQALMKNLYSMGY